jgi:hypothetical protein
VEALRTLRATIADQVQAARTMLTDAEGMLQRQDSTPDVAEERSGQPDAEGDASAERTVTTAAVGAQPTRE